MVLHRWLDPTHWPMATPRAHLKLGGGSNNNLVIFNARCIPCDNNKHIKLDICHYRD